MVLVRCLLRPTMVAGLLLFGCLAPTAAAAVAAGGAQCPVVEDLRTGLAEARAKPDDPDVRGRVELLFRTAARDHPECQQAIRSLLPAGAPATGAEDPMASARGFLGPIGWFWNTIYYRVFQGNGVMMATFGWALFLSPVIFVFSAYFVLRGAGSVHRPPTATPPPSLRQAEL